MPFSHQICDMIFFSFQFKVSDLDNYLPRLEPAQIMQALDGNVMSSNSRSRRESASVIDEFFQGDTNYDINVNVNMNIKLMPQYANHDHLRTGLMPLSKNMCAMSDSARRESASIVDEFFEPKKSQDVPKSVASNFSGCDNPPVSSIVTTTLSPCLLSGGSVVQEDLWEEVSSSMNMLDSIMTETQMDTCSELPGLLHIKPEKLDDDEMPSCKYHSMPATPMIKQEPLDYDNNVEMLNSRPSSLELSSIPQPVFLSQKTLSQSSLSLLPGQFKSPVNSAPVSMSTAPQYVYNIPVTLPPTPPSSEPGSPSMEAARRTPPPPYPGLHRPHNSASVPIHHQQLGSPSSMVTIAPRPQPISRNTHPGCTTIRYNRKNNPELEKRRIHYCDFPCE